MPNYSYECDKCGEVFDLFVPISKRHDVKCKCGWKATKLLASSMTIAPLFQPMWYNDICETPIYVNSKKQLKDECKKHNVIACRLL